MAKNGITNPKKDWKEWKDPFQEREKNKKKLERERSFLNGNVFLSVPVPTNFGQRTSLPLAVAHSPQVVPMPCIPLGLVSQVAKRWCRFSVLWMPRFSNLDAAIQQFGCPN